MFNSEEVEVEQHTKKKRRDPNAPKPPASNYFLFTNSIREKIDKLHPTATFAEKSKIYGVEWQKLTEEQKKVNICFVCVIVRASIETDPYNSPLLKKLREKEKSITKKWLPMKLSTA